MYAINNCKVYTGKNLLVDKAVIIDSNKIVDIISPFNLPAGISEINLGGLSIAPGFIDIQVNGGGGCLFNEEPSVSVICKIYEAHKRFGTTNFLPVLLSNSRDKMMAAVKSVKYCLDKKLHGILGLHLEGPFINRKKAGVHNNKYIRTLNAEELNDLIKAAGSKVLKLLTVAPEFIPPDYLRMLSGAGVLLSAGHSDITYDEAIKCFENGITCVTHLFNAMSQLSGREPGLAGAALQAKNVWAGIIADGFHVHYAAIDIAKRIKGRKLFLTTDAMPPVGKASRNFMLGDYVIQCRDGKCTTETGVIAGSVLDMATAVRNCIYEIGIPIEEALRMASTYPAEFLGMGCELGKIEPGYNANLVIFDDQVEVKGVVVNGKFEFWANS
ncbi:MAG: N-acetylglucosamine-6-phosphate deacetylase [Pelotomaculum sp. PtaB.Bin013]|nr:N-acetylglucosamine-6-phosphate deacetylase [Pelotomaculum isophthalicicum]OPX89977.1 MAG: N-acetylglucosamine-6-phosphate deacetylase [Pelotomaculum sp. PtaB.Bin013]